MIRFQAPTPAQRGWAQPLLMAEGLPLCDYSFPLLCCWRDAYSTEIAPLEQRLLVRLHNSQGTVYLWPAGRGDPRPALDAILQDAHRLDEPLRLASLTAEHQACLEEHYPGRFSFQPLRDGFDYLYEVQRLAQLPGKKLHAKRTHIHRLDENCPGWTWAPMTDADLPLCQALDRNWLKAAKERETAQGLRSLDREHRALQRALQDRALLGIHGLVLRWQDQLLGFTLGAPLSPTVFDVSFERAREDIQGAYPAVTRSFARWVREHYPDIRYLNREEDMGLPGLRKAKQSYYPDLMGEKIYAVEQ